MENNPYPEFIGCLVAFENENGDRFQGKLIEIYADERSIVLDKAFKNGFQLKEKIKLLGDDMKDLVVKKMPSPPSTPNMLENELENFGYEPVDKKIGNKKTFAQSKVNQKSGFSQTRRNSGKNANAEKKPREKKMAKLDRKIDNLTKNDDKGKKFEDKENNKILKNQRNTHLNSDSDKISSGSVIIRTFYNQEHKKTDENKSRGLISLIEQANVDNVLEKLKISSSVKPQETSKIEKTTSSSTSWYQNPLKIVDTSENSTKNTPISEKIFAAAIESMQTDQQTTKKSNILGTSRGKFQPAHKNLQPKAQEVTNEDPLKALNIAPSGKKPLVIEIAEALSAQRKQQLQNLVQNHPHSQPTITSNPLPDFIQVSEGPSGYQVKSRRRYFEKITEKKNKNEKKNHRNQKHQKVQEKNSRVERQESSEDCQNQTSKKNWDTDPIVFKENKNGAKNKQEQNKINRSERNKPQEPEESAHSQEEKFDKDFFGRPKSAGSRRRGGFVHQKLLNKEKKLKESKNLIHEEKLPIVENVVASQENAINESVFNQATNPPPQVPLPPQPIDIPNPIAPSVANFFAQYNALKEEVTIKEGSKTDDTQKIDVENEREPPQVSEIPIPNLDMGSSAASNAADSMLSRVFEKLELRNEEPSPESPPLPSYVPRFDLISPERSESESDVSSNIIDEEEATEETSSNESDTTESTTDSNLGGEMGENSESESISSQIESKGDTDTEESEEIVKQRQNPHTTVGYSIETGTAQPLKSSFELPEKENFQQIPPNSPSAPELTDENTPDTPPSIEHEKISHELDNLHLKQEVLSPEQTSQEENTPKIINEENRPDLLISEKVEVKQEELDQEPTTSKAGQSRSSNENTPELPENSLIRDPRIAEILKKWPYNKLPATSYRVDMGIVENPIRPKPRTSLNQTDMWFYDENGKAHTIKLDKN